jgi:hypothetical protein
MRSFDLGSSPNLWRQLIQRKEQSANSADHTALLAGIDLETNAPVLIPQSILEDGHVHISGRTGSGKTAAALMSMAMQILRNGAQSDDPNQKSPIIVIDLKGDRAFFNSVRDAAREHGRKFRYLSTRAGDDYHFFDPLQIFHLGSVTPIQLASVFVRAFSLDYGLIYGGLYFTHQNMGALLDAANEIISQRHSAPTIGALSRILDRLSKSAYNKDARHIQLCLKFLAECEQVNIESHDTPPANSIDMLRVLEDSEVVYFYLELEGEAPSLRQIAAFALYTLVQAAKERRALGLPTRSTYVIIDEFYHIAGKSFGELLSTVRHLGLHMMLANQTTSQLENHDKALPSIISTNTVAKIAYTLTSEEAREWSLESGEKKELLRGFSRDPLKHEFGLMGVSAREAWTSNLSDDALKFVNDTRLAALLLVQDGNFHQGSRVKRLQTLYPIPKILYDLYQDTPFPRRKEVEPDLRPEVAEAISEAENPPHPTSGKCDSELSSLHLRMEAVWQQMVSDEAMRID